MKKQKLKLEDLKVQSFVTSMGTKEKQTVDGGFWHLVTELIDLTFPAQIGSGGACSEGGDWCTNACPVPEGRPWCTIGGDEDCGIPRTL